MTVMISPNPDKQLADVIAVRAAQILLNHGSHVLMRKELQASCNTMGVSYLPEKECLQQADIILTIGGQPFLLVARGDWAWSRGPPSGSPTTRTPRSRRAPARARGRRSCRCPR